MLEQFREFANNKIVRIVFVLFLAVPFGLFGIDYYFKAPVGGDAVANVGRSRIGSVEFDQALRRQADIYRQQLRGQFDPAFMDNPEVRASVLDRLVNERLMSLGAERAGVRVTDKQIAAKLAAEPIFASGFSAERYSQLAKAQGLTPAGLDERLREDYRQQQFRSSIIDTAIVPRAPLDSFIRISEQTREVSAVNLAPEAYTAKGKVTPEQIKAVYDSHAPE